MELTTPLNRLGNVAGGGVITSIIYTAFALLSSMVLNLIASVGWLMGLVLIGAAVVIWLVNKKDQIRVKLLSALCGMLGLFGLLQAFGLLSGVPVLALGIPAILSVYFDIFSGCIQAYIFAMLTMLYVSGGYPGDDVVEALALKRRQRRERKAA